MTEGKSRGKDYGFVSDIVDRQIKTAEPIFDKEFGEGVFGHESIYDHSRNDLRNIKKALIKQIKDNIGKVDWSDSVARDRFCNSIDEALRARTERFVRAHNRDRKVAGRKVWDNFTKWLSQLRDLTLREIMAEIAKQEKLDAIEAENAARVQTGDDTMPLAELVDESKPEVERPPELKPKFVVVPKPVERKIKPVEFKSRPIIDVADELREGLGIVEDAARDGDGAAVVDYAPHLVKLVNDLDRQRREAEQLWAETYASLSDVEGAKDEVNEQLIGLADAFDELKVEKERQDELVRRDRVAIDELRSQLSARDTEISVLKKGGVKPPEVIVRRIVRPGETSALPRIEEIRFALETQEKTLSGILERLSDFSTRMAVWMDDLAEEREAKIRPMRALAEDETEYAKVKRIEDYINARLDQIEKQRNEIERKRSDVDKMYSEILRRLEAIRTTEQIISGQILPINTDFGPTTTMDLPDIDEVLSEADQQGEKEPKPKLVKRLIETVGGVFGNDESKVSGELPYSIEFTGQELADVKKFEQFLVKFQGANREDVVTALKKSFPTGEGVDIKQEYFNQMVDGLIDGNFVNNAKIALTLWGAFYYGNNVADIQAKNIGHAALYAKLAPKNGPETSKYMRVLVQLDMLQKSASDFILIEEKMRTQTGKIFHLTQLGQSSAKVWTAELIEKGVISPETMANVYKRYKKTPGQSVERAE